MDAVSLTVIFKGLGMLLAISGGIFIGRYGYHLYKDGAGVGRDKAGFELGPIKIQAHSVGSIVMATAFLWAWAGVTLSPSLDKSGENVRVYSFVTPKAEIKVPEIMANSKDISPEQQNDPAELKILFEKAASYSGILHKKIAQFQVNGMPAVINASNVNVSLDDTGNHLVSAKLSTKRETATVTFEPKFESGKVIFVPSSAEKMPYTYTIEKMPHISPAP